MNKTVKMIVSKFLAVALLPLAVYAVFAALRPQALLSVDIPFMILNQCLNSIVLAWGMSFAMMIGNMDFSAIAERILGSITRHHALQLDGACRGLFWEFCWSQSSSDLPKRSWRRRWTSSPG